MKKAFKYLSFIILCGCEIDTPSLPPLDKPSFSYEEVMKKQRQLKQEIAENSAEDNSENVP